MSFRDEFLYPAATPLAVAARGGLAIATKKMFARRKQGIKGGRRRFMRKLPPPHRARRPSRPGRRNEGRKIASARYDSERNFIPTRRPEFLTRNALNIAIIARNVEISCSNFPFARTFGSVLKRAAACVVSK